MGTDTEAQIILLGYDEYSGARKFFSSKIYKLNNVITGNFLKGSMQITENLLDIEMHKSFNLQI
jgi:hypothetical protein